MLLKTAPCNEINANFDLNYSLDKKIQRIDFPQKIPLKGRLAYHRKE